MSWSSTGCSACPAPTLTAVVSVPYSGDSPNWTLTAVSRPCGFTVPVTVAPVGLVACGTLLPGGVSIYRWEGAVTEESEVVVLLKTDAGKWDALCAAVGERHPYEVPELLALTVGRGLQPYLAWLAGEVVG